MTGTRRSFGSIRRLTHATDQTCIEQGLASEPVEQGEADSRQFPLKPANQPRLDLRAHPAPGLPSLLAVDAVEVAIQNLVRGTELPVSPLRLRAMSPDRGDNDRDLAESSDNALLAALDHLGDIVRDGC